MLHISLEHTEVILLCPIHYHQIYKKFKLAFVAAVEPIFRHSPDPSTVSHYLSATTENTPHIKATECLCLSATKYI